MSVEKSITEKLSAAFPDAELIDVLNESSKHNVPKGSETHFKVILICDSFKGTMPLDRHRGINELLKSELTNGVHALSITAKTKAQWQKIGKKASKSPPCLGGGT